MPGSCSSVAGAERITRATIHLRNALALLLGGGFGGILHAAMAEESEQEGTVSSRIPAAMSRRRKRERGRRGCADPALRAGEAPAPAAGV